MKNFKRILTALCLLAICSELPAQYNKRKDEQYFSVGIRAGISNYFGDLNPLAQYVSTDLSKTRHAVGVDVAYRFSREFEARIGLNWARLTANDFEAADPNDERHRFRYYRNNHFRNDVFELSFEGTLDLLELFGAFINRPPRTILNRNKEFFPIMPYAIAGISVFYHDPRAKTPLDYQGPEGAGEWVRLKPLRTEGQGLTREFSSDPTRRGTSYDDLYSLIQVAVPIGLGVRTRLSKRIDIAFEIAYRFTFTDYLDDVGGNYADPRDLLNFDPLSYVMANRTLEPVDARTGEERLAPETFANAIVLDDAGLPTLAGYGNDGDKRGESVNTDIFLTAGFRLSYIFPSKESRDYRVICATGRGRGRR